MKRKRGEITVFLSLIMVCCLSLFLGLLESARTAGAGLYLEMAANSAMSSVMSQYNRNLWDMYHLLFLEAESEDAVKESFESFLSFYTEQENLYPMKLEETDILAVSYMDESGGEALEREIAEYMKHRVPDLVSKMNRISDVAQEASAVGDFKQRFEDCLQELSLQDDQAEEDSEDSFDDSDGSGYREELKELFQLENITGEQWKQLLSGGFLSFVLPNDTEVSSARVSLNGIPSKEMKKGGRIPDRDFVSPGSHFVVNEYCLLHFDSFLEEKTPVPGYKDQPLKYEMEYLLYGNPADRENLSDTIQSLIFIRGALNLIYLMGTPEKKAEADGLALAVSAGNIPLQAVLSTLLLTLWSVGEAILDVRGLLAGGSVPFRKSEETWQLSLEQLRSFEFLKSKESLNRSDEKGDYEDYLRILCFLMERGEKNGRIMDLIQWNVRTVQPDFAVEDCIGRIEVQANVRSRHLFFDKEDYLQSANVTGTY